MIIEKITEDRWKEAQVFELNIWKPQIECNPKETWCNFEKYFERYFIGMLKSDWSGKTIMEIGVGAAGAMWMTNAKRKIGIEPLADKLKEVNPKLYSGYEMISHGAEAVPEIESGSVDMVMSFNALDHCMDVPSVLS